MTGWRLVQQIFNCCAWVLFMFSNVFLCFIHYVGWLSTALYHKSFWLYGTIMAMFTHILYMGVHILNSFQRFALIYFHLFMFFQTVVVVFPIKKILYKIIRNGALNSSMHLSAVALTCPFYLTCHIISSKLKTFTLNTSLSSSHLSIDDSDLGNNLHNKL